MGIVALPTVDAPPQDRRAYELDDSFPVIEIRAAVQLPGDRDAPSPNQKHLGYYCLLAHRTRKLHGH